MEKIASMRESRSMLFEVNRLKTFSNWIYNNQSVKCTAEKMAEAGFYMFDINEEDAVKCFVCMKQLDGWERDDDPFEEHKKHATYCPFVKIGKAEGDLTLAEFLKLSQEMETKLLEQELQEEINVLMKFQDETIKMLLEKDKQNKAA